MFKYLTRPVDRKFTILSNFPPFMLTEVRNTRADLSWRAVKSVKLYSPSSSTSHPAYPFYPSSPESFRGKPGGCGDKALPDASTIWAISWPTGEKVGLVILMAKLTESPLLREPRKWSGGPAPGSPGLFSPGLGAKLLWATTSRTRTSSILLIVNKYEWALN